MRSVGIILLFVLCRITGLMAQGREEFNGPFAGWANVKKQFGAKGNGKDDDTKALQRAIDELSNPVMQYNTGPQGYMVIYLPAGTYNISSTLVLRGKIGVSIIGEDPSRTIIRWTGGDKDTLFWADGSAYFKIARLTWDAGGRKDMEGVGIHWKNKWNDGKTRSFASLNIELSDNYFTGGFKYGISGGYNFNDSEIAIRRCVFNNCTVGILITGFNALDYWIWDCKFLQCGSGVECHDGGYHVYRSFFSGSKVCDVHNYHGYYNSVRGCYSVNCRNFSVDETLSANPFKRTFQDNTVVNAGTLPIWYFHLGKLTLWGNRFSALRDTNKVIVYTQSWAKGIYEVMSLYNTYPYANPILISSKPNKIYSIGDKTSSVTASADAFLKEMDALPPKVSRKIFEVPTGASSAAIQSVLDQAAALRGQRPVVHFPMGNYVIDKPLVIPAGTDMQLKGDGLLYASVFIKKAGAFTDEPIILVKGPSYAGIQDLQIGLDGDKDNSPCIQFEGVDQPGSQAHLDQIYSHADTSISLRELDNLYVQKDNSFFTDGNVVSGGPLVKRGGGTAGLYCYGGQFEHVRVDNNGRFLSKDCWWEGDTRVPLDLEGNGTICIDGAMIAPNRADSTPTIRIGSFKGHISLMNMYLQGALLPQGNNSDLNLLAWNIHFYHKMDPLDFLRNGGSYKGAFLGLNAQCFIPNSPVCKDIISIPDRQLNIQDINTFVDKETAFDRMSSPVLYKNLPVGSSNIYLSRVSTPGKTKNAIVFTAR
ncbi:MAG: hypothetical protein J0H74_01775 [Chitinophagaceae bacterium]|nr:hypothetical protein [Chitinophagaceae bacterium]